MYHKHRWKIIGMLMLIALLIRIYRVGFLSLWVDEFIHALPAKQFAETGSFETSDNNGILLTVINCFFVKVFGLSEVVLRLPSVLAGTLLVPVSYFFGRKVFSVQVGLLTAILVCFSPYLVFWSRIDRMYELVSLFYLATISLFWVLYQKKEECSLRFFSETVTLNRNVVFVLLVLSFLCALLSQVQSILFFLSVGFYGSIVYIDGLISKSRSERPGKIYRWLGVFTIACILLFFTPLTNLVSKPFIDSINNSAAGLKIPGWITGMLAPDWGAFTDLVSSSGWNRYFLTYYKVTIGDYPVLGILGWLGFAASRFCQRRSAYYLICMFTVPVIAMSFFLREPNEPRYLCFIYPVFLCSVAVFLSVAIPGITAFIYRSAGNMKGYANTVAISTALVIVAAIPYGTLYRLINSKEHGFQLKREIGEAAFVNWKEPGLYVKQAMQAGDLVFSTVKNAADFYTGRASFSFRQRYIDRAKKVFVPNPRRAFTYGADSYDEFVQTMRSAPRGWLLLDHYLYSEFTDERIINFVHAYCSFHPGASEDGSVRVFSWDNSRKPANTGTQFVAELGKPLGFGIERGAYGTNDRKQYSQKMFFNACTDCYGMEFRLYTHGIDYRGEAAILLNDKMFFIPPPVSDGTGESIVKIKLGEEGILPGRVNQIRFVYTPPENGLKELAKGFYIKTFNFTGYHQENR